MGARVVNNIEDDILDLLAELPDQLNDASVTTELKFLTVGGVLWACRAEIIRLREELRELKKGGTNERTRKRLPPAIRR
jgi:hypothetical protein